MCDSASGCEGIWHAATAGDGSRTVVHDDDVQAVEQLPLVLVDPLHVHIEHGGRVDLHPVLLLQQLGELELVVLPRKREEPLAERWSEGKAKVQVWQVSAPTRRRCRSVAIHADESDCESQ